MTEAFACSEPICHRKSAWAIC